MCFIKRQNCFLSGGSFSLATTTSTVQFNNERQNHKINERATFTVQLFSVSRKLIVQDYLLLTFFIDKSKPNNSLFRTFRTLGKAIIIVFC